jgi:deoxyribonuclease IV
MLGVHCSISGGIENAVIKATELGIDTFQIFTKNQRQWRDKVISEKEGSAFKKAMKLAGIKTAFAHCTYLINLSSESEEIREKSVLSLASELLRCEALGLKFCVLHPGSSIGQTEKEAIGKIAKGLKMVLENSDHLKTMILLENTAGQGSSIGWKFEHLRDIMKIVQSERLGICIDTCHAFAAGYDIRTKKGFEEMISSIDKTVGLKYLKAFHLNDSKGDFGSRIDRHEHIGLGKIGLEPFRQIMKKFPDIPKVVETNHENNMHIKDLETLNGLK